MVSNFMFCVQFIFWTNGEAIHLQFGADHLEVKLIWVLLQSFLSQSSESVLFLVVITVIIKENGSVSTFQDLFLSHV